MAQPDAGCRPAFSLDFMKVLLILLLLFIPAIAQDRSLPSVRRTLRLPPQLIESDDHMAQGLAQSPMGYPIVLGDGFPIPSESIIGLYGESLLANDAEFVLLTTAQGEYTVAASAFLTMFPKLERIVFRLPEGASGEVWVRVIGMRESNSVRLNVE